MRSAIWLKSCLVMSRDLRWQLAGPLCLFVQHFSLLLPFYFTLNALLIQRPAAEWAMRNALLKSMVLSGQLS